MSITEYDSGRRFVDFDTLANEWTDVPAPLTRDDAEAAAGIDPRHPLRPDGNSQLIPDRFRYSPTPLRIFPVGSGALNVGSNQIALPTPGVFYKISNQSGNLILRSVNDDRGKGGVPVASGSVLSEMCDVSTLYIYCTQATTLNLDGTAGVIIEYGW